MWPIFYPQSLAVRLFFLCIVKSPRLRQIGAAISLCEKRAGKCVESLTTQQCMARFCWNLVGWCGCTADYVFQAQNGRLQVAVHHHYYYYYYIIYAFNFRREVDIWRWRSTSACTDWRLRTWLLTVCLWRLCQDDDISDLLSPAASLSPGQGPLWAVGTLQSLEPKYDSYDSSLSHCVHSDIN